MKNLPQLKAELKNLITLEIIQTINRLKEIITDDVPKADELMLLEKLILTP